MKLAIVICLARVCTCAILVGVVCDLLNFENYSTNSLSHGNPRKLSTSKIERYTVLESTRVRNFWWGGHINIGLLASYLHLSVLVINICAIYFISNA